MTRTNFTRFYISFLWVEHLSRTYTRTHARIQLSISSTVKRKKNNSHTTMKRYDPLMNYVKPMNADISLPRYTPNTPTYRRPFFSPITPSIYPSTRYPTSHRPAEVRQVTQVQVVIVLPVTWRLISKANCVIYIITYSFIFLFVSVFFFFLFFRPSKGKVLSWVYCNVMLCLMVSSVRVEHHTLFCSCCSWMVFILKELMWLVGWFSLL